MRIEYMFIGKTADERTPQKKDITNAFKECFDDVKSNSFTIKPKTKVYTIDYEVNSWKAEDATEKFPVYDVIIKSEVEEKAKNAELLDIINTKISTCAEFRKKYNVVITYNEMSAYYAEKIYPYFFTFESKLRCLVYKILIKMFGCKWVNETMRAEIISEMQQKLAAEEGSCNSAKLIEKALDEMTYRELEEFLFSEKRKTEPEEFLHILESETDFQGMTKEEIIELITSNEHKSNWEKYFKDKVPITDLQEKLNELRKERNKVAHCKKFIKDDYDKTKALLEDMIKNLDLALAANAIIEPDSNTFKDFIVGFLGILFLGALVSHVSGGLSGAVKSLSELSKSLEKTKPLYNKDGVTAALKHQAEISKAYGDLIKVNTKTSGLSKMSEEIGTMLKNIK